ncbi:MAG: hypothetical protein EZS28_013500 [Streblomastix strix]|uniref:Uncharacterized protein n=1 Tax=Streblomastix strix TaxID=222440 RepID=A0A5J4W7S8_9EUKA|nr:MAG: hypothetical protein EZS28_013500 [Streblomastix strix]
MEGYITCLNKEVAQGEKEVTNNYPRLLGRQGETIMSTEGWNLPNDAEMKAQTYDMTMKLSQRDITLSKFDITDYRQREASIQLHPRI